MDTLNRSSRRNQILTTTSTSRHTWVSFPEQAKNRDEGNDIVREDYPNGYALYAFYLGPISPKDILTWRSKGLSALN